MPDSIPVVSCWCFHGLLFGKRGLERAREWDQVCANAATDWFCQNALGFYNFIRSFGWACKRGAYIRVALYPGGLISGIEKMFRNDEIKRI